MARFLAYTLFVAALALIGADLVHFWDHGVWSSYTVGALLAEHGVTVNSMTAPMTHELLAWLHPAPLGVMAAGGAVCAWMMQPHYFPKVIADIG